MAHLSDLLQSVPLLRGLFANRSRCRLLCDIEPQSGAPIFIAVHGTWAHRSGWTRPDSKLLRELGAKWPGAGIYRFRWSGTNGARHRLVASDVLSEQLDRLASLYPLSRIVTIAHSHGGNVVAWASTRIAHSLCAAIYLNTPFIQVLRSPKTSSPILRIVLWFGGAILWSPLLALPDFLFPTQPWPNGIMMAILLGLMLAVLAMIQKIVPRWVHTIGGRLMNASNGSRKVSRELVSFVVGDEPSAALGAVYLSQWLGRRAVILLLITVFGLGGLAAFPGLVSQSREDQLGPVLIGCCFAICFLFLIFATSAYGLLHGLVALDSAVTVTPAPVGQTDFTTIAWAKKDRLRHSLIYESPEAIASITLWLGTVLKKSREEQRD